MRRVEAPSDRFGYRNKPFHLTGEVDQVHYLQRLHEADRTVLVMLLDQMRSVATNEHSSIHILAVGSSADIHHLNYGDIDLLVCTDPSSQRFDYADKVRLRLTSDPKFTVLRQSITGSAPINNEPYQRFKLFVFPKGVKPARQFDITFVGNDGGSINDVLHFHQSNNLAFSLLSASQ